MFHFPNNSQTGLDKLDDCVDCAVIGSQNFTYDALNRIATAYTTGTTSPPPDYSWGNNYVIDAWGNLTNMNSYTNRSGYQSLQAAPANWKNQLNITGQVIDAAGNLTNDGLGHAYIYDAENRLSGAAGWAYTYDGDGKRIKKCNSCSSASGGTLYWTGMGSDPMAETNLGGTLNFEYIFFNGRRTARRNNTTNPPQYYFADHLGSTSVFTDNAGAIKSEYDFSPYGAQIVTVTETVPQNYKFTGKERDTESGLDYFGARFYGSNTARFSSPDPDSISGFMNMDDPQAWNGYSYTRNNPTRLVDPIGEEFVEVCIQDGKCFFIDDRELQKQAAQSPGVTLEDGKIYSTVNGEKVQVGTYEKVFGDDSSSGMAGLGAGAFAISQTDSPAIGPMDVVALGVLATGAVLMSRNRHNETVIEGLVETAAEHIGTLQSSPPSDPNRNHWKKEAKAALDRAKKVAERLPGKAQEKALQVIRSLEGQLNKL